MKKIIIIFGVSVIFICVCLSGCDWLSSDECDKTTAPEIRVGIQPIIHFTNPYSDDEVNWVKMYCYLSKIPCGDDPKGFATFDKLAVEGKNEWTVTTAGAYYNLRNTEDLIWIQSWIELYDGIIQTIPFKDNRKITYNQLEPHNGGLYTIDIYLN